MAFAQLSPMIQNQIRSNPTNLARRVVRPERPAFGNRVGRPATRFPRPGGRSTTTRTSFTEGNHALPGGGATMQGGSGGSLSGPMPVAGAPVVPTVPPATPIPTTGTSQDHSGVAPVTNPVVGGGPTYQFPTGTFQENWQNAQNSATWKPYLANTAFKSWFEQHPGSWGVSDPNAVLNAFRQHQWQQNTPEFNTWLNTQADIGLLGQGFDAQKAAYLAAHGGQAGQVLGRGFANLTDPAYMQKLSEIMLANNSATSGDMASLAGLMTPNASGISPYAAAMLQNLRAHSQRVGNLGSQLSRRGLFGGGGAVDYGQAAAGAQYAQDAQTANQTWGPDRAAALQQAIIQGLQAMNTDQYSALTDALGRGLAGVANPQIQGGVPNWTSLLGQWGNV